VNPPPAWARTTGDATIKHAAAIRKPFALVRMECLPLSCHRWHVIERYLKSAGYESNIP